MSRCPRWPAVLVFEFASLPCHGVLSPPCLPQQALVAEENQLVGRYGASVAIDGDTAIVGAPDDASGVGSVTGAVYVFQFDGSAWNERDKLSPFNPTLANAMEFGSSVAIDGATLIVGAPSDAVRGNQAGAAYVFRFDGSTWVTQEKLYALDAAPYSRFGYQVSLKGNVALITAIDDDEHGIHAGAAYIFRFDGSVWTQESKLVASDATALDRFGASAALDGNIAVVGAPFDDDNGPISGSAYVFRFNGSTWVEEAELQNSDPGYADRFGLSLSVSGSRIMVGVPPDDNGGGIFSGSVYMFRHDGLMWREEQKLVGNDPMEFRSFGSTVLLSGDMALVGASSDDDNGPRAGALYVFRFDGAT